MFYASFNAADSKTLTDGFKQLYPKIDAVFYRTTDAALMERILTEARAGQYLWDVAMTTSFYGHNLKKRGVFASYDSPERKILWRRIQGPAGDLDVDRYATMPRSVTTPRPCPRGACRILTPIY